MGGVDQVDHRWLGFRRALALAEMFTAFVFMLNHVRQSVFADITGLIA